MAIPEKRTRKMAGAQTPLSTALLIDGELVAGQGLVEPILNPATGEVLTRIAEASSEQVEGAILAAHRAFTDWSRTTPQQRSNILLAIADAVEKQADHLARLESLNCGKPLHLARQDDLGATVDVFRFSPAPCAARPASSPASTCRAIPAWCGATLSAWWRPSRRGTTRS